MGRLPSACSSPGHGSLARTVQKAVTAESSSAKDSSTPKFAAPITSRSPTDASLTPVAARAPLSRSCKRISTSMQITANQHHLPDITSPTSVDNTSLTHYSPCSLSLS
mgnify:CR=1 FL=1